MRNVHAVRSLLAVLTAASVAVLATACNSQVVGLDGTLGEGASATASTTPGRPVEYTGFLINRTGHVVTLESATLLPLQGFPAARLVHEAVEPRLRYATSDRDWPPDEPKIRLWKFSGYRVPPGHRVNILYSVVARKLGNYAATGFTLTVLISGRRAKVDIISVAGTCIYRTENRSCPDSFIKRLEYASNF